MQDGLEAPVGRATEALCTYGLPIVCSISSTRLPRELLSKNLVLRFALFKEGLKLRPRWVTSRTCCDQRHHTISVSFKAWLVWMST